MTSVVDYIALLDFDMAETLALGRPFRWPPLNSLAEKRMNNDGL
jgi:hypothetical protein